MRWDVEVFFKLIKSNFKFSCLKEHNLNTVEQYKKNYFVILIILHLIRLIEYVHDKHFKKRTVKENNKNKYNIKHNNSLMISGFKKLIKPIIYSKINGFDLDNYCKNYIKTTNNIKDVSNPRKSKTPFSKWYVKSYMELYKYKKLIKASETGNTDKLNKNLKSLTKNIEIIK